MITEPVWEELERQAPRGPGLVRRRFREDSDRNIFLGVTYPGHERALQLVVSADAVHGIGELPETRSLRTTLEPDDESHTVEVNVTLIVPEMARVFTPFCEDVIAAAAVAPSDGAAVAALLDRFAHWRRLLASENASGLSRAEAQGLYGELWVLRHVVDAACGERTPDTWRGPDREDRDFLVDGFGIEVKTTGTDEPTVAVINGERQLSTEALRRLHLIVLKLDALREGAGGTLNEAVEDARRRYTGMPTLVLQDKLLAYGYRDADAQRYELVRYSLRAVLAFEVLDGFPRLTESDLPQGIGALRYSLATSACEPWKCDVEDVIARLRAYTLGGGDGPQ